MNHKGLDFEPFKTALLFAVGHAAVPNDFWGNIFARVHQFIIASDLISMGVWSRTL
jgi:hypothetical protein